jgi:DNA-directed RNA polymerase specialized sigma24 family protein
MYFEECSIEEIAKRMGWTKAGTKMRAMRARGKLKKIAEKEKFLEKF